MKISPMKEEHWIEVKRIYQAGIDTGQATFEDSPPDTWRAWLKKFLNNLSLVYLAEGSVLGWAAVSRVSSRQVYQGVGEISLYVDPDYQREGIGKELMEEIIKQSEIADFWTLQAGIFPENFPSINLHKAFGFRVVGERRKIGKMTYGPTAGEWRDVVLMERRKEENGSPSNLGKEIGST
ncbi:MAG TPA: N-acetyltransferase family protein [Chloroflexi bacterium]|nr:N-acetyltransferase family protein [Chloroflexota bacterium]